MRKGVAKVEGFPQARLPVSATAKRPRSCNSASSTSSSSSQRKHSKQIKHHPTTAVNSTAEDKLRPYLEELEKDGFVCLPALISSQWLEEAKAAVEKIGARARFGGLRLEYNFALDHKPFDSKDILEHPEIQAVISRALGVAPNRPEESAGAAEHVHKEARVRLLRIGAIKALPECDPQPMHRDGQHLFSEISTHLPPHALHLWIPLTEYNPTTGATIYARGSHRSRGGWEARGNRNARAFASKCVQPALDLGQAIIFDDRVFHQGAANLSSSPRTCVFYSFARSWFTDGVASEAHPYPRWADRTQTQTCWQEIE